MPSGPVPHLPRRPAAPRGRAVPGPTGRGPIAAPASLLRDAAAGPARLRPDVVVGPPRAGRVRPRRRALLLGTAAALPLLLATAPAASAAAPAACRTALAATLSTHDPTTLQDRAVAPVRVRRGAATGVRVVVSQDGRTVASGTAARVGRGTTPVVLRVRRAPEAGTARVRVTGTVDGCGTVRASRAWTLRSPSLPVRAALRGSTEEQGRTVVRVLLRTVGGRTADGLRVELQDADGRRVAGTRPGRLSSSTEAVLRAAGPLGPGRYRVVVSGRTGGSKVVGTATQTITLSKATQIEPAAAGPAPSRQRTGIAWTGDSSAGRDVAGFVVPGIGYGELVCSAGTQWLRVFPTDVGRESSMLTWTYRSWDGNRDNAEKALREALHTQYTGLDFNEGFNKFQPAEKQSTGEFTALVSDRGPFELPGAPSLSPPVGIHVTWAWDFRDPSRSSCTAQVEVVAQTPGAYGVGSAQVLWRGDAGAVGRDQQSTLLPGVGTLAIVCQATPEGRRAIGLQLPTAATVTTREGSVDTAVPAPAGPLELQLPNNGQLQVDTASGARVLISSRWKVNDPDPTQNSCAVAAQSVAP